MSEGTITRRLLDSLPHFLRSLRYLEENCIKNVVEYDAFIEILNFKSLVELAAQHHEPWQELWQHPDLLWSG